MITERHLTFRDFHQHGIGPHGNYRKTYWACELRSNTIEEGTARGFVLRSDCETIQIRTPEDLKTFEEFDKFARERRPKDF